MTKPTMQPAGAVDAPPRGQASERSVCIRCERRRPMRLDLLCPVCAGEDVSELPLFTPEAP